MDLDKLFVGFQYHNSKELHKDIILQFYCTLQFRIIPIYQVSLGTVLKGWESILCNRKKSTLFKYKSFLEKPIVARMFLS